MKQSNEGGLWTITLFAANEIPSVVVTFVALIIFLQRGEGVAMSTLFASLLLLPWVGQPLMRKWLPGIAGGRGWLHVVEILLCAVLATFALTMTKGRWWTMGMLMSISVLSAWHDLLANRYYMRRTQLAQERYHSFLRTLASQASTVFTYGLMIMAVGALQIYFRQRSTTYSWSLGVYVLSGAYLLLTLVNLLLLRTPQNTRTHLPHQWPWQQASWKRDTLVLMLMLLPQGLMFFSRTIFLLARPQHGGLGCTLQEIGFAQGTIGVIAFLFGVTIGRFMQNQWGEERLNWPLKIALGLSPTVYLLMTLHRPENLFMLSTYTFLAQSLFGIGLNSCRRYIERISGVRYQNAVNPMYIPIISMCIMIPMVASGFLLQALSYEQFFCIDALCAPITWILIWIITRIK